MEETKEQQSLHRFMQACIYFSVLLEIILFVFAWRLSGQGIEGHCRIFLAGLSRLPFYRQLVFSKLFTLLLIGLVSTGTLSKKEKDFDVNRGVLLPLILGLTLFFSTVWIIELHTKIAWAGLSAFEILYILFSVTGTITVHIAIDNASKLIHSRLGKDKWNVEEESFMQPRKPVLNEYSVNIPMLFYFKGKVRKGWINLENIFRGTILIGTPGSGKSFSVVNSFIRQLIAKGFTACIYDFKFPDLAKIAWYHYQLAHKQGKCKGYNFHVINLNDVEMSRRINPWRSEYIKTLADASETAEALVEALKKGDKSGGSDQFFTQSAVNFLASCIYFFSRYQNGKYSSLPHVLAFLNQSYEEIFTVLFSEPELVSLLSPFATAYKAKAYEQLEGQVGTLKIFISRLATKETFWVFSADDFNLKISSQDHPSILILANDPGTQNINSACYSVVLNRLTRLINSKGNKPCALIIDEVPTLFMHRIENLIATARSNKVAVLMGLQELPQFKQQYGKDTATTITSVVGNVLSGSVRNKETLDWLERLFGKVKQRGESLSIDRTKTSLSINEKLEPLIPAGKIAALKAGELVGILAADAVTEFTGRFETSAINCRVNLNMHAIANEEKHYLPMPRYYNFAGDREKILRDNFRLINREVRQVVEEFLSKKMAN